MQYLRTDLLTALRNDPFLVGLLGSPDAIHTHTSNESVPRPHMTCTITPETIDSSTNASHDVIVFTVVDMPGNPAQVARGVIEHLIDTFVPMLPGMIGTTHVLCACPTKAPEYHYDELREEIHWQLVVRVKSR